MSHAGRKAAKPDCTTHLGVPERKVLGGEALFLGKEYGRWHA